MLDCNPGGMIVDIAYIAPPKGVPTAAVVNVERAGDGSLAISSNLLDATGENRICRWYGDGTVTVNGMRMQGALSEVQLAQLNWENTFPQKV